MVYIFSQTLDILSKSRRQGILFLEVLLERNNYIIDYSVVNPYGVKVSTSVLNMMNAVLKSLKVVFVCPSYCAAEDPYSGGL